MALHVSFGGDEEYADLPVLARRGKSTLWTLAISARQDDTVIFYIKLPVASFVASGRVLDDDRNDGAGHGWPGQLMGRVGDIAMLDREVPLREAASRVPAWKYLRQPHRNITVPEEHEAAFLKALGSPAAPASAPEVRVLENLHREATVLSRSRNRGLRDTVIRKSSGRCAACDVDYSKVEPKRWNSVLQAHHIKPLHQIDGPVETAEQDLVALCPTCHVFAHLGGKRGRSVGQVRRIYGR